MTETHDPTALTSGEEMGARAKAVMGKMLKWGLIGALAIGLLFAAAPVLLGGAALTALPFWISGPAAFLGLTTGAGASIAGAGLATVGGMALNSGLIGAAIGGVGAGLIGLFSGLSSMDDAVEDLRDTKTANYDQAQRRRQMAASIQPQRGGGGHYGSPNVPMGRGGREVGVGG